MYTVDLASFPGAQERGRRAPGNEANCRPRERRECIFTCIKTRDYVIDYTTGPEFVVEGCRRSLPPSAGLVSLLSFSPIGSLLIDTSGVVKGGEVRYVSTVKLSGYSSNTCGIGFAN